MTDSRELLEKLMETFRAEAEDHLGSMSSLLIALEKESGDAERKRQLEIIYRRMHTLKGAAHMVNLPDVVEACQSLESLLAAIKREELHLGAELLDGLHDAVDSLGVFIFGEGGTDGGAESSRLKALILRMESLAAVNESPARTAEPAEPQRSESEEIHYPHYGRTNSGEMIRVPAPLLDELLLQAEEFISAKLAATELVEDMEGIVAGIASRRGDRAGSADLVRAGMRQSRAGSGTDKLAAMVEELTNGEIMLENRLRATLSRAEKNLRVLEGMVDNLLDGMKKVHLLPFSALIEHLPKTIRDIARDLGKSTELACSGTDIEIDRRILAELREPLLHIIRNMIDHGIEKPGERRAAGKPATGGIRISLGQRDGNRAELVVTDDGRGIDIARVKGAALGLELITPQQAESISDDEVLELIFNSGVSTSPMLTTMSGRGVGLAIVRESLERLGGHVTVSSRAGRGTEFRLVFPLSFATIRGLLVEVCGRCCLVPAANVELTARIAPGEIRSVENRETINVDGRVLPLVGLGDILGLRGGICGDSGHRPAIVLTAADKRIAFAVDRIMEVREVLAKPLGPQLSRVKNVAGAVVLGNGEVVPVLNVNDLLRSAVNSPVQASAPAPSAAGPEAEPARVLIAEDSITSRTLLRNILEASGFRVSTAVDGIDALTRLKTEEFDIVVSDVEMPRMNGFELTAAIRQNAGMAGMPVILVTGLESREDRERGIDVGASAYIVKSSFDQGRLVEVIRKFT